MVDLTTAQSALKEAYLSATTNQLNTKTNPLFNKIKQSNSDIFGKYIIKPAPYGLNGGISAGTETGDLPNAGANNYKQFKLMLKNLYGKIEISDKAVRASQATPGAFVDLLNSEIDGLLQSSKFNLARMLYGNGTGLLATASAHSNGVVTADRVKGIMPGMILDIITGSNTYSGVVTAVNEPEKKFTVSTSGTISSGSKFYVQGSKDNELTGIEAIFDSVNVPVLYGIERAANDWLTPYTNANAGTDREISDELIQLAIDNLEQYHNCNVDFISCGYAVKRAYQKYLNYYKSNVETTMLDGGFRALSFYGIPMFADKFVDDKTMYVLDSSKFTLHQLCDWEWLEGENGRILQQIPNKASYSATLVKYADLLCDHPAGVGKILDISGEVANPLSVNCNCTAGA